MIVKLSKDCQIEAVDGLSFTLKVRRDRTWKTVGYYSTLRQAVERALEKSIMSGGEQMNVKELIAHLERFTARIVEACEAVGGAGQAAILEGVVTPDELESFFNWAEQPEESN